jgi:hypothetical protein
MSFWDASVRSPLVFARNRPWRCGTPRLASTSMHRRCHDMTTACLRVCRFSSKSPCGHPRIAPTSTTTSSRRRFSTGNAPLSRSSKISSGTSATWSGWVRRRWSSLPLRCNRGGSARSLARAFQGGSAMGKGRAAVLGLTRFPSRGIKLARRYPRSPPQFRMEALPSRSPTVHATPALLRRSSPRDRMHHWRPRAGVENQATN